MSNCSTKSVGRDVEKQRVVGLSRAGVAEWECASRLSNASLANVLVIAEERIFMTAL